MRSVRGQTCVRRDVRRQTCVQKGVLGGRLV